MARLVETAEWILITEVVEKYLICYRLDRISRQWNGWRLYKYLIATILRKRWWIFGSSSNNRFALCYKESSVGHRILCIRGGELWVSKKW